MSVWSSPRRRDVDEHMDAVDADAGHLARSLGYLASINRLLGYARTVSDAVLAQNPGKRMRVLDVASGGGDVAVMLARRAKAQGIEAAVVGIDLHGATVQHARSMCDSPAVEFIRGDAMRLPFADDSVDVAMTSLFLHHLDDGDVVTALAEMRRVSRGAVVVADLLRRRRAYFWAKVLSAAANPMVRHDALVSVRQAFHRDELIALARAAGFGQIETKITFGHRVLLVAR